jgi:prophage antirepressor-like protein
MPDLIPMQWQDHRLDYFLDEEGNPWWPAHGPFRVLGLDTHTVKYILARLDDDEKRLFPIMTPGGMQKVWCVNEPGLYELTWSSRKPQARAFRRWVKREVLPEIRRTGGYGTWMPDGERFFANTRRPIQVQNAKDVGTYLTRFGGKGDCIRWYRQSLKGITGAYPKDWREKGKEAGLAGRVCQRGREVVRKLEPAAACAASLADDLVMHHIDEAEAIDIGRDSIAIFQRILKAGKQAGYTPRELRDSPLDDAPEE